MELLNREDVIKALKSLENHYGLTLSADSMNKINAIRDAIASIKALPKHGIGDENFLSGVVSLLEEEIRVETRKAEVCGANGNYVNAVKKESFVSGLSYAADKIKALANTQAATKAELTSKAVSDVIKELARQRGSEGFTAESDLTRHNPGEIAKAGICYLMHACVTPQDKFPPLYLPMLWPWDAEWWKPKDKRRNVVRGIALMLAELERMDNDQGNKNG